ncbi:MAG: preprotein translocase subunit SecG [Nitrospinota bacterium]|nr:MAG: preprotein translocase subunit SecG [Nitrospinota bacterium]
MYTGLVILHVIVALALILIVLLQTGKGASLGAAFGGSSETVFGSSGAGGFLSKLTTAAAVIFMLTSLILAVYSSRQESSIVLQQETPVQTGTGEKAPSPVTGKQGKPAAGQESPAKEGSKATTE